MNKKIMIRRSEIIARDCVIVFLSVLCLLGAHRIGELGDSANYWHFMCDMRQAGDLLW
jgi:hypothetical protein